MPDEEGPITGTLEHVEWLLSGLAGEYVYCLQSSEPFDLRQREWHIAHLDAWFLHNPEDYNCRAPQPSEPIENCSEKAPLEAQRTVSEAFNRLSNRALQHPKLQQIAIAAMEGDVSAVTLSSIWNS